MRILQSILLLTCLLAASASSAADDKSTIIVVVGAPGEEEYATNFESWAGMWRQAAEKGGANCTVIGLGATNETTDIEQLKKALAAQPPESVTELWLVFIGHGTFDGKEAKFNLRGPDVSATDLAAWLKPFKRPIAVIDSASASAPFMTKLAAPGRVIVTATRSGFEQNYARFGRFLAEAIANPEADLDKDGQTSLLESFLMASRKVTEFYKTDTRLATEHALLDDNGDGLGTPADWFRGIHAVKRAKDGAALDGSRAHQLHLVRSTAEQKLSPEIRAHRDALELEVNKLRDTKAKLDEDEYYRQLEVLLLQLARLSAPSLPVTRDSVR